MVIITGVYLCIRGATVEALASQLQKGVFRRRSWIAHPSSLSVVARNYIWTDAVFTRVRGLPTMANLQSEDGLLGPLTSVLCYSNGMYSMETTPPHDWRGLRSFKYINPLPCTFQSPTSCWHKHSPWSFDQAPPRTNDICHL